MFNTMGPFGNNKLMRKDGTFSPFLTNFFDNDFFSPMNYFHGNFNVDLKENDKEYFVEADLPGIKKGDIDIDVNNNYLTITAKRNENQETNEENYVRRERHYGEFKRSFYMDNVDEEKIEAYFNDGVLQIVLPKLTKDNDKKKRIEIH